MNSETYIDFCFIRNPAGNFAAEIDNLLRELFKGIRLNWYLEEKTEDGMELVVAEIKGMSRWQSEEDAIDFIESHAAEDFWEYLQGFQLNVYPAMRGCGSCGTH
ncbi:hypothetical protein [Lederbergia citrea]|uniref:hypothetical protein n=1 Tax=Lederbergia citrea TaxID=2833581 RepID=UPI001BC93E3D|nr:hypothetical protein [Lederbergia citrea]MBS4179254.1 hypothetical protein [Lederbergia citrea]